MITPSLDTCKRLKENGFKADTEFLWQFTTGTDYEHNRKINEFTIWNAKLLDHLTDYFKNDSVYYAPTAEEILEQLPDEIEQNSVCFSLLIEKYANKKYSIIYFSESTYENRTLYSSNANASLSEACAEMWLWCKDNGYLKEAL